MTAASGSAHQHAEVRGGVASDADQATSQKSREGEHTIRSQKGRTATFSKLNNASEMPTADEAAVGLWRPRCLVGAAADDTNPSREAYTTSDHTRTHAHTHTRTHARTHAHIETVHTTTMRGPCYSCPTRLADGLERGEARGTHSRRRRTRDDGAAVQVQ